jgi:hypothetical protein
MRTSGGNISRKLGTRLHGPISPHSTHKPATGNVARGERKMDEFTFNHFCNWLNGHVHDEERMSVMQKMYERFLADPEFWATKDWDHLRTCATRVM